MRIGLVPYRCENKNIPFNLSQIERAMRQARGKAELLCFGEAFVQGFDCLCWDYEADRQMALTLDSAPMQQLRQWTRDYHVALLTGYIERDGEELYSSCAVLAEGEVLHNYRRITTGWKESWRCDAHYREGTEVRAFLFQGRRILLALCGDLWDCPERFRTEHLLIWPVYVSFSPQEWEAGELAAYAQQAALAADDVLLVNPIDREGGSCGGAVHFQKGRVLDRSPFDREEILLVDID